MQTTQVRLRLGGFDAWAAERFGQLDPETGERSRPTDRELARLLGEHETTLSKYLNGRRPIGKAFVLRCLAHGASFDDLFRVEPARKVSAR